MAKASSGQVLEEALFSAFIWAYVGLIFGTIFVGLVRFFEHLSWPIEAEIPAAALSGAVAALFYGSMQLSVFAVMAGTMAGFGYLGLATGPVHPQDIFLVSGLAGLLVGAAYGMGIKESRVFRAEAKILAGLCAGFAASALLLSVFFLLGPLPLWATSAVLCLVTGNVYVWIAPQFIDNFQDLLPPMGDGALAGAGVAAFAGLAIWVVVGELHAQYTGPYTALAGHILDRVPQAAGGAAVGGALGGFVAARSGRGFADL